ncbi:hypothetical protein B0H16DRAFT_1469539 [Mycena metata]|uniref:Uncharacterized protein n=1 Tax=Mycena metata TaxID=1033252 RepID=A0AAD7MSD2_9AGAR|nr:hypothetical protein B0H16DRAFT_1469539 [Mycena metata]
MSAPPPKENTPAPQSICASSVSEKRKKKKGEGPKLKPGNKDDFHSKHYNFLIANLDAYLEALKQGKTRKWWPELFEAYWSQFYWRLALDEEPAEDAVVLLGRREELMVEEENEKEAIQKHIKGHNDFKVAVDTEFQSRH